MKLFLKSFDTYKKDLILSHNNSIVRGIFNLSITLFFIIFNCYIILRNIVHPKLNQIVDKNKLNIDYINLENIFFEVNMKLEEYYSGDNKCSIYIHHFYNKTIQNLNFSYEAHHYRQYDISFNISVKEPNISQNDDILESFYSKFLIMKRCPIKDQKILDDSILRELSYSSIQTYSLNMLDFNNKEKFISKKREAYLSMNNRENKYQTYTLNLFSHLIVIYNDYKTWLDFNTDYSSIFINSIENKNKLKIKDDDYMFNIDDSKVIVQNYLVSSETILTVNVYYDIKSQIYIRNYYHFLYYFPMFLSIFSSIIRGFGILNSILTYHYKYFDFMNNNCSINYVKKEESNRDDTKVKCEDRVKIRFDRFDNNQEIENIRYKESMSLKIPKRSNYLNCNIIGINDYNDNDDNRDNHNELNEEKSVNSNNIAFDKRKGISKISNLDSLISNDEINDLDSKDYIRKNFLKYNIGDAILFALPSSCCRSKKANCKYRILKDVKKKLYESNPSYSTLINNSTSFLINKNLIEMFSKDTVCKPIYSYSIEES